MSRYEIAVYKSEKDAGVADLVRSTQSLSYLVPTETFEPTDTLRNDLQHAFASTHSSEFDSFDLYYMRDVLASTGWNKNKDIFDKVEAFLARHTPEDKPFNFEHSPLDIIGHITASHVVDESMNEIADNTAIEDLPDKFHIVNGSVLYMMLGDDERKKLMQQTVAEIKKGEWFVSMECFFRGFDYGVIGPDGSERVLARTEATAFLTKHLTQYGGTGVYKSEENGEEYSLGRVLRNITFSGKGLVRKPANPHSIILNAVADYKTFVPAYADLGYLTITSSKELENSQMEKIEMPETNTAAADQTLRDLNVKLEKQLENLQVELANLKSKDMETVIAGLRKDVTDRDGIVVERDKTITGLKAQIDTVTASVADVQKRAETAEAASVAAQEELKTLKTVETKRSREAVLRTKNAPEAVIAGLVEQLSVLNDEAFNKTVDTISASWKSATPTKTKADPVVAAVQSAKVDDEPALATASDNQAETTYAAVTEFMGKSLKQARGGRPSVFANTTEVN